MAINTPSTLQQNLIREYWDTKLQDETLFRDLFSALRTPFDRTSNVDIPMNAITMELNAQVKSGFRSAHIGFLHALQGAGREGDQQLQIMNEETFREKEQEVYYNEYSHAVSVYDYGIHANEQKAYGLNMETATRKLGAHAEEKRGLYYRQALMQRYGQNLTMSPVAATQPWNSNVFVKGVPTSQQPQYSPVLQDYTDNIGTACVQAGTSSHLDGAFLNWLHYQLTMGRYEGLQLGGKSNQFILTVPPAQKFHVLDLTNDNSIARYWTDVARMNGQEQAVLPDLLGRWVNIWLVEDERAPTLTINGSAAPFTLTPGYVYPGNNDQRDTSVGTRDVGFVIGRAPIIDWINRPIHHKYDDYNYQKWQGKGYFGECGVQLRWYDDVTPTSTSLEQRWSAACIFGRGDIENY